MKIYTKTGDKGQTSLIGGARVYKFNSRIEAYGTIDELNSYIGLVRDQEVNEGRRDLLKEIQDRLFTIGANLATEHDKSKKKIPILREEDITLLEEEMDKMSQTLPEMRAFILPGGHTAISFGHVARCVCRRAERLTIKLGQEDYVEDLIIVYLNRLSDYLFMLCRKMHEELRVAEIPWKARL